MTSEKDPLVSERSGTVREVGNHAIWSLSSCKPGTKFLFCTATKPNPLTILLLLCPICVTGFGIDQLRDDCMDTYWQSDGQLPHLVNIQFQRKTMVSHIYIYTDYKLDESYTPSRISIRAGTHFNDLQEIEVIELIEPSGEWLAALWISTFLWGCYDLHLAHLNVAFGGYYSLISTLPIFISLSHLPL